MKLIELGDIAQFVNGYAFKPSDWGNNGLKIIRIQNLTNSEKLYNRTTKNISEKYKISKGDILVSWSATLEVFEWQDEEDGLLNQHIFKVELDSNSVDKKYFIHVLRHTIQQMAQFTHGSTMKHIVRKDFLKHKVPLPPINEQIRIVKILEQAESLILKRTRAQKLLNDYLESTFLKMFGDPSSNLHDFNLVTIADVTTSIKDGPHVSPKYADAGIPILSTRNVRPGKIIMQDIKYVSEDTYNYLTRNFKPQINDILLTKGGTTGYAKIVDFKWPFCVWVHIAVLRPKSIVNPVYLENALNSDYSYQESQRYTHGIGNQDLGLTRIAKIKLLLPPMELQNKFADVVSRTESIKQKMLKQAGELDVQFQALVQKSFQTTVDLK